MKCAFFFNTQKQAVFASLLQLTVRKEVEFKFEIVSQVENIATLLLFCVFGSMRMVEDSFFTAKRNFDGSLGNTAR